MTGEMVREVEAALRANIELAVTHPQDPLGAVKAHAERVTGCECRVSYDPDDRGKINVEVIPRLDVIEITLKVE